MKTQVKIQPVLVLTHKQKRQVFPLSRPLVTIGRSSQSDICVYHGQVSRCQSVIRQEKGSDRYLLFDGDGETRPSRNGTFHNWQRIRWAYLEPEDVICFGSPAIVAKFCLAEEIEGQFHTKPLIQKVEDIPTELLLPLQARSA